VVRNTRWQLYSKSQTPLGKRTYTSLSLSLSLSVSVCKSYIHPKKNKWKETRRERRRLFSLINEGSFRRKKEEKKKERRENYLSVYSLIRCLTICMLIFPCLCSFKERISGFSDDFVLVMCMHVLVL